MSQAWDRRVAVVGSGQTQLRERWGDRQHVDLISAAVSDALLNAGIEREDVDFVIDSGSDILDGRSISNAGFLGALGAHHKEESRVEEDGLWSALYGVMKITSGSARVGLIVAYSKPSESSLPAFFASQTEPFVQRPVGMDHLAALGFQAQRYLNEYGLGEEELRRVVKHDWAGAAKNPSVDVDTTPTEDEISSSELVAAPLRSLEVSRPVDGAVAIVVAVRDVAERLTDVPIWITGIGTAMDEHFFALREADSLAACGAAAEMAFRRAGIDDPSAVSLVETGAASVTGELMTLESMGFAEPGAGADLYEDGGLAINPSGGSLPADPVMATGLVRLREAASVLAGRVHDTPAPGDIAVAHGTGGIGMQNHAVFVLEV